MPLAPPISNTYSVSVDATPPFDGGSPITSYTAAASNSTYPVDPVTSPTLPILIPNLLKGYEYLVTVYATNAIGDSPQSSPPVPYVYVIAPNPVTNVVLLIPQGASGSTVQAVITFDPPTFTGGAPITGYNVDLYGPSNTFMGTTNFATTAGPLALPFTIPSATGDYFVLVYAVTSGGHSSPATSNTFTVVPL